MLSSQVVEGRARHHGPALDVVALLQAREDEAHHDAPEHQHHHQDQAPEGRKAKEGCMSRSWPKSCPRERDTNALFECI